MIFINGFFILDIKLDLYDIIIYMCILQWSSIQKGGMIKLSNIWDSYTNFFSQYGIYIIPTVANICTQYLFSISSI